jgi:hypothetical protein
MIPCRGAVERFINMSNREIVKVIIIIWFPDHCVASYCIPEEPSPHPVHTLSDTIYRVVHSALG